jgi:hypothetical protein
VRKDHRISRFQPDGVGGAIELERASGDHAAT